SLKRRRTVDFKGNTVVEEFSSFLKHESPRCTAIVSAAFFDETLGRLLGDTRDRSFHDRIEDARDFGLLTLNEHHDLHVLRQLRNTFAHDLRAKAFDTTVTNKVESLELWRVASSELPNYTTLFPTPEERLVYVAGIIAFRLQRRAKVVAKPGPWPEPPITDVSAWPPVTSR